jgi:hypothetical protein
MRQGRLIVIDDDDATSPAPVPLVRSPALLHVDTLADVGAPASGLGIPDLLGDDADPSADELDQWIARWNESADWLRDQNVRQRSVATAKERKAGRRALTTRQTMIDRFKNPALGRWDLVKIPIDRPE